ncbi:exonuclease 1-like [Mytilus californianus]|uniref:exonuclease 1-like n=1 Tax=Mytilus californianus TaxID=6549 RepID=UPI002245FED9|nr:exonuclease 1-like [Mytilus californianus]
MGIQGLLPFLKKIHDHVNIAKFSGCTVAIDAYCWLHKGAFSCAEKLALGEKTDQYVYYCMKYLEYMLKNNLKPIMVFDGCHLPSKKDVEKTRREKRNMYKKKAAQLLREGNRAEARECLQRCIDISPEMALRLMEVCRERGIDCIVAPYEADAQLAFLSKSGIAQIIVTEDSDLLLFGCERVIFKMDHFGNGVMIEKSKLNEVMEIQNGFYTFDKFQYMCILSGCDYLPSLSGIGLAKACKVFKLARQADLKTLLKKFPTTYLKMSLTVTDEYIDGFIKAYNTFLYQLVFDPLKKRLVPLHDYEDGIESSDVPYAGPYIPHEKALQIALGNINIYTMEKFANFNPDNFVPSKASKKKSKSLHMLSMWNKNYRIRPKTHLTETQNRPNLKGKEVVIKTKIQTRQEIVKPADDSLEVKTDGELTGMYQNSPKRKLREISSSDDEPSPCKRRRQNSSSGEELSPKKCQKFMKSPRKPEFFSSLVEADVDSSICDNSIAEEKNDKENDITSPRRNRFALVSPSKKAKFNLNAPKEVVKSRFFASSSSPCIKTEPVAGDIKVDQKLEKSASVQSDNETKQEIKNIVPQHKKDNSKPSNKSAFSWNRFKSSSQNSIESSPHSRNPFKRVVSEKQISSTQKKSCPIRKSSSQPSMSRSDSQKSLDNLSQVSSYSNLYSIDSDCFSKPEDMDDLSDCESSVRDSETNNSSQNISSPNSIQSSGRQINEVNSSESLISQVITECPEEEDEDIIVVKTEPGTSSQESKVKVKNVQKAPTMSGCHVSGLSRGKKKTPAVDIKQQSLKDMFSKFSNNRTEKPKLKHEKSEDLNATPTTDNSVLSLKGGIQRCLLP